MIPSKRLIAALAFNAWARPHPKCFRAALDVLDNVGATPEQVDLYCALWPAIHHAQVNQNRLPCPRCFMVGRKRWLSPAAADTRKMLGGPRWEFEFVCGVCGYTPYVPYVVSDTPPM